MLRIYLNIAKLIVVENRATQDRFLRPQCVIFRCQKYVKKGYIDMTKKIYLETFKKCPGSLCFTLLMYQIPLVIRRKKREKRQHK